MTAIASEYFLNVSFCVNAEALSSSATIPRERWHIPCMQWHIDVMTGFYVCEMHGQRSTRHNFQWPCFGIEFANDVS